MRPVMARRDTGEPPPRFRQSGRGPRPGFTGGHSSHLCRLSPAPIPRNFPFSAAIRRWACLPPAVGDNGLWATMERAGRTPGPMRAQFRTRQSLVAGKGEHAAASRGAVAVRFSGGHACQINRLRGEVDDRTHQPRRVAKITVLNQIDIMKIAKRTQWPRATRPWRHLDIWPGSLPYAWIAAGTGVWAAPGQHGASHGDP